MLNQNYDYQDNEDYILSDLEKKDIINNLTDDLLIENILEQIAKPSVNFFNMTNYIEIFKERLTYLKNIYKENNEFLNDLKDIEIKFYDEIFTAICKKFNITTDDSNLNIIDITEYLYIFFILNYKENLIYFYTDFIIKNKESLAKAFNEKEMDVKKISVTSLKKIFSNKNDVTILASLRNIIDFINNDEDIDNLELIENICCSDIEEATNYFIKKSFIDDMSLAVNKDFVKIFLSPIINKTEGYSFIITEVNTNLYNAFNKIKKKED